MYYEDMSMYQYESRGSLDSVLNIGWLDSAHSFAIGKVDARVCSLLKSCYSIIYANQMRGYHCCNLCENSDIHPTICVDEKPCPLGSAELWIPSLEGFFAAPDLIIHYIESHSYRPPDSFVAAVLALPTLPSDWQSDPLAYKLCYPGSASP
jgi:hypothetical protein